MCWFSKGATNNFGFCRLRTRRTRNGRSMCIEACCEWVRSTLLCLHNFFCFSSSFIFAQNALRREFSIAAKAQHRGMRFLLRRKGEGKTRICRFCNFWVDIRSHKKGFNYRRRFAAIVSLACNESLRLQGLILRCKLVRTATVLRHKRQPCIIICQRPLHKLNSRFMKVIDDNMYRMTFSCLS